MSLEELIGEGALNLFIKPQVSKFLTAFVAREPDWTPAEKTQKVAEMEDGLMDALTAGLSEALAAKSAPS